MYPRDQRIGRQGLLLEELHKDRFLGQPEVGRRVLRILGSVVHQKGCWDLLQGVQLVELQMGWDQMVEEQQGHQMGCWHPAVRVGLHTEGGLQVAVLQGAFPGQKHWDHIPQPVGVLQSPLEKQS